jgi:iron complex transport system substrate-binding protein
MAGPARLVCLTEETTETLYLLGREDRIVGISGYTVRPPRARREKPRVSAFTSADADAIEALAPDLVLAFSDLQAPIAADLAKRGLAVHLFNQRDVSGILAMIRTLGRLVDAADAADRLAATYARRLDAMRAAPPPRRPRVYLEEWDEPMICGIGWWSELTEIAGGLDVFAERARSPNATGRIVTAEDIATRRPELILASWCGKKVRPERIRGRAGMEDVPAVRAGAVVEIKSPLILQPGPAALTDGLDAVRAAVWNAAGTRP